MKYVGVVVDTGLTDLARVRVHDETEMPSWDLALMYQIQFSDLTIENRTIDPNETDEERIERQRSWEFVWSRRRNSSRVSSLTDRTKNVAVYLADTGTAMDASNVVIAIRGSSDDLLESLGIGSLLSGEQPQP